MLLLHGFLGTWYMWRKVIPLLADSYQLIAPDMRGCGDSEKPPCDYDALQICEDFRALVRHLGLQKIRVVAHGIGAAVALLWAAKYPGEICQLGYLSMPVLKSDLLPEVFNFSPARRNLGGRWWWGLAQTGELAEQLIVGREREFLTWFYQNHAAHPSSVDEAFHEYLRTFAGHAGVAGSMGPYRSLSHSIQQTEEALAAGKVKIPVIALGGDHTSGPDVRKMVEKVATDVTGGVIADCGHFIPEEQPETLTGRLRSFFVTS